MSVKIETISGEKLVESKWPIATLQPPIHQANRRSTAARPRRRVVPIFDSLIVNIDEKQACAQAFTRYKRANPGFDYRSRREGAFHRFWRIA